MKAEKALANKIQRITRSAKDTEVPAFMGNLSGTVKADNNNNVYVTLLNGQVETVKNNTVPAVPMLPIIIGSKAGSNVTEVLRMRNVYDYPPYVSIPNHFEKNHSEFGVDPARITAGQFFPGLAFPIAETMTVRFYGFVYYLDGYHIIDNQVIDLSGEVPVAAGANMVLVEVDSSGVVSFRAGITKDSRELLTYEDIPLISATKAPLFAVSVYFGQTQIIKSRTYTDIYDLRFAGVSTGGISTIVEWADILSVPSEFNPDTDVTDLLYPRKWIKNIAPTVNDDDVAGYSKSDVWVDQANEAIYICLNNATGAAAWWQVPAGSGDALFYVDGTLAVIATSACNVIVFTKPTNIPDWSFYIEDKGSAGTTTLDIHYVGGASIFTTQANRPSVAYDAAENLVVAVPDITDFVAGDVLELHIDAIATGAKSAVVAGRVSSTGAGGSGFNLNVEQSGGTPSVDNIGKIVFDGAEVTDDTGGQVTVKNVVVSVTTLQTRTQGTYTTPTSGDGIEITPLNIVLTPRKAGNKIILEWVVNYEAHEDDVFIVTRNGTRLANTTDGSNNRYAGIAAVPYDVDKASTMNTTVVKIIDESSLDIETTYALLVRSSHGTTHTFYLNRTVSSAGADQYETGLSVGTAMEINT